MTEQPEALRLANELESYVGRPVCTEAAAELRRLLSESLRIEGVAYQQHSEIYGLRLKVMNLEHNIEVLTNALWKACGDDRQVVDDTIESQGALR